MQNNTFNESLASIRLRSLADDAKILLFELDQLDSLNSEIVPRFKTIEQQKKVKKLAKELAKKIRKYEV